MSLHKSGSTRVLEKSAILFTQGFFPFFNFSKLKFWKVRQWKKEDLEKISEQCTFPGKQMEEKLRGGGDEGREWKRKTWLKEKKMNFLFWKLTSGDKINIFTFPEISHETAVLPKMKLPNESPPSCHKYISIGKYMCIKSRMKNKLMLECHAQGTGWVQWGAGIKMVFLHLQIAPAWDRQIPAGS